MIVETQKRDIQRSDSFQERSMGLAVGSEAFVFNVLRKDLYSDPIGSLIREYTVNAQDEHRKFGKSDTPIFIQVPNHFSPELHIRDYAGGLTEEQVFEFFGNYGASDKRDSNVAVGFFGLGCKSAFAYTDSYIVKSFKDGMEYTFNIYIDETEIGKTAKISAEPTTEPNGILIIVPVKTHDINTFQQKVLATVKHFKVRPTISGMENAINFDTKDALIKGEDWEFFGRGTPTVIMGEIPYPVDSYKMGDLETWERNLLQSEINIRVGIGDVQVTASREALQMSEKTITAIRKKLTSIKDSMVAETEKAFSKAKNLIEAKMLWNTLLGSGSGYSTIIRSQGNVKWKGEELDSDYIRFDRNVHSVTNYYVTNSSSGVIKSTTGYDIYCKKDLVIYFDDTDQAQVGYKRRARTLLNGGVRDVTIIHTTDRKALEDFLGMPVKELASLNAVTPTVASSTRNGGTGVDLSKRAKHTSKVFVLNVDKLQTYYKASSEVWDVKEVDLSLGGVYVPIDRFKPVMNGIYGLDGLSSALNAAKLAGLDTNIPIYGIKNGGDSTGLVKFTDWLDTQVKSNKELLENYSLSKAYSNQDLIDASRLKLDKLPDSSIAKEYATLYNKVKTLHTLNTSRVFQIFKYTKVNVDTNKKVKQLSSQFGKTYPMLELISEYNFNNSLVLDYIIEKGE